MKYMKSILSLITLVLVISIGISCKNSTEAKKAEDGVQKDNNSDSPDIALEPVDFAKAMKRSGAVIVDLRFPVDYQNNHIEDAINVNFFDADFQGKMAAMDKSKKYFLYGKGDAETKRTCTFMRQNGFNDAFWLKGGWDAWEAWKAAGSK